MIFLPFSFHVLVYEDAKLFGFSNAIPCCLGNSAVTGLAILVVSFCSAFICPTNAVVHAKYFVALFLSQFSAVFEDGVISRYAAYIDVISVIHGAWRLMKITTNWFPFVC